MDDRWLGRMYQRSATWQKSKAVLSAKDMGIEWCAKEPDCRTQVFTTITISPVERAQIPPEGLNLN